jgi:hypothetical protein
MREPAQPSRVGAATSRGQPQQSTRQCRPLSPSRQALPRESLSTRRTLKTAAPRRRPPEFLRELLICTTSTFRITSTRLRHPADGTHVYVYNDLPQDGGDYRGEPTVRARRHDPMTAAASAPRSATSTAERFDLSPCAFSEPERSTGLADCLNPGSDRPRIRPTPRGCSRRAALRPRPSSLCSTVQCCPGT